MFIRFIKPVYDELKRESEATGKSIPNIVQEILCKHFNIQK